MGSLTELYQAYPSANCHQMIGHFAITEMSGFPLTMSRRFLLGNFVLTQNQTKFSKIRTNQLYYYGVRPLFDLCG